MLEISDRFGPPSWTPAPKPLHCLSVQHTLWVWSSWEATSLLVQPCSWPSFWLPAASNAHSALLLRLPWGPQRHLISPASPLWSFSTVFALLSARNVLLIQILPLGLRLSVLETFSTVLAPPTGLCFLGLSQHLYLNPTPISRIFGSE